MSESVAKVPTIPLWAAVVVVASLLTSTASAVVSGFTARSDSAHAVMVQKQETNATYIAEIRARDVEQDSELTEMGKVLAEVVATQSYMARILDRLEARP